VTVCFILGMESNIHRQGIICSGTCGTNRSVLYDNLLHEIT
jgi:hypothetical protein